MELTQKQSLQQLSLYKYLGSVGVPTLGAMLLVMVGLDFRHSANETFDLIHLVAATLGIAVIGLSYYSFRRSLNQLQGKVDANVLSKLLIAANSMAIFGYLVCMMVMPLHHH
jgi:hypothetical protein